LSIAAQHLDDAAVTRVAAKRASSTRAAMKILDRIPRKPPPAPGSPAADDQAAQAPLETARELLERLSKGNPSAA
jgi:hypothetical protein